MDPQLIHGSKGVPCAPVGVGSCCGWQRAGCNVQLCKHALAAPGGAQFPGLALSTAGIDAYVAGTLQDMCAWQVCSLMQAEKGLLATGRDGPGVEPEGDLGGRVEIHLHHHHHVL